MLEQVDWVSDIEATEESEHNLQFIFVEGMTHCKTNAGWSVVAVATHSLANESKDLAG